MRRLRLALALLAVVAIVTVWRVMLLPVRQEAAVSLPATDVTVAYHIHTTRSDGTGSVDEVAAAARAAGVRAVLLTDHGDGTRPLEPPQYRHGVLVVDGAEIGTSAGHYVALGGRVSPFPLGGDPASVVEDVATLGSLGIAAHPASSRERLRWSAWTAPIDGLEWLNADSEWRDRPRVLWSSLLTYPWAPVATIAALLDRPVAELAAWDRLLERRAVVGLAAHDAHARLGVQGSGDPYDGAVALRLPSYATLFAAFTNVVRLDAPPSGEAAGDALRLLDALRRGRAFSVVTAQRTATPLTFEATFAGGAAAGMGEHVVPSSGAPVTVRSAVDAPEDATSHLVCNGREVATSRGGRLSWTTAEEAGACRLEVRLTSEARAPWIVSNPIYLRHPLADMAPAARGIASADPVPAALDAASWTAELAADAAGSVAAASDGVAFHWALGNAPATYAAWRLEAPSLVGRMDGVRLRLSADRPMRVWLQWRTPTGGGVRWGRSIRVGPDTALVARDLPLDTFAPLDGQTGGVTRDAAGTLLVVVDTVHTRRGESGVVVLHELGAWAPAAR